MAKIIKLTDNNNTTLLPVTDAKAVQVKIDGQDAKSLHDVILEDELVWAESYNELNDRLTDVEEMSHQQGSDIQTLSGSNGTSNVVSYIELSDGGKVGLQAAGGLTISYTSGKNITITQANNHAQGSDIQKLSGEYRSATKTAYVKLVNGNEVGFHDKGGQASPGTKTAHVEFSYTNTSTDKRGIGIKVTYADTIYTHPTFTIPSVAASNVNIASGTTNTGKQEVITSLTLNSEGHVTGYTKSNVYSYYQSANMLNVIDTRTVNDLPFAKTQKKAITAYFKSNSTVSLPSTAGTFSTLMTITGWGDSSGGFPHQLAFSGSGGKIYHRVATSTSAWGSWSQLAKTDDIPNDYLQYGEEEDACVFLVTYSEDYKTAKANDICIDSSIDPYHITTNQGVPASIDMSYSLYTTNTGTAYQYITRTTNNGQLQWRDIDAAYVYMSYAGTTMSVADVILENEEITASALNDLQVKYESLNKVTAYSNLSSGTVLSYVIVEDTKYNTYVPVASTTTAGIIQIGTGATNAAAGNHNHTITYNGTDAYIVMSTNATNYAEIKRATNLKGGAANRIPYQTAANTTSFIAAPSTSGTVLKYNGSSISWQTDSNDAFLVANSATATQANNTSTANGAWLNVWSNQTAAQTTVTNKHSVKLYGDGPVSVTIPAAGNVKVALTTYLTFDVINSNMENLSLF